MDRALETLDAVGLPAALWDHQGRLLEGNRSLRARLGGRLPDTVAKLFTGADGPLDFPLAAGEFEVRLLNDPSGPVAALRVGYLEGYGVGVIHEVDDRARLQRELEAKTSELQEKVLELSRSKRAILNILEDLEDRSRELSRRKEELEVLNYDLQRFNRDLERANKELRSLDETKSNLLSNVSHELRTPLVAIKGYSDLMFRGKLGPVTEKQRLGLEVSLKSQDRLLDLINNLLDFSRIEIGRLELMREEFVLGDLVDEVLAALHPRAAERGVDLRILGRPEEIRLFADRTKIGQILTNLISNAIKFNRDDGRVEVTFESADHELAFSVRDTGIGIPPEHVGRIFDRFFQVDAGMSRRYGGTGLGLSIVKSLVELHGGSIQVVSEPDKGATFLIRLPRPLGPE